MGDCALFRGGQDGRDPRGWRIDFTHARIRVLPVVPHGDSA